LPLLLEGKHTKHNAPILRFFDTPTPSKQKSLTYSISRSFLSFQKVHFSHHKIIKMRSLLPFSSYVPKKQQQRKKTSLANSTNQVTYSDVLARPPRKTSIINTRRPVFQVAAGPGSAGAAAAAPLAGSPPLPSSGGKGMSLIAVSDAPNAVVRAASSST